MLMNCSTQRQGRSSRNHSASPRQRVLKVACQVFARHGFDGTHIREICELAGVNIAALCYYFHSKEGLYAAVQAEAREQLSSRPNSDPHGHPGLSPEERLQAVIGSLFAKLSADSAWIAHLLARELADGTRTSCGMVGDAFRADLIVIASIIRDAVGREADPNSLCLAALTILSQCVFLCAARTTLPRILPPMNRDALRPQTLMAYLAQSSLRGLSNGAHPSVPNTAPIHIRIPLPAPPTRKTAAVHQGSRP